MKLEPIVLVPVVLQGALLAMAHHHLSNMASPNNMVANSRAMAHHHHNSTADSSKVVMEDSNNMDNHLSSSSMEVSSNSRASTVDLLHQTRSMVASLLKDSMVRPHLRGTRRLRSIRQRRRSRIVLRDVLFGVSKGRRGGVKGMVKS
jgi:hypothetical protein